MRDMEGNWMCNGDLSRPSCQLSSAEYGELDSVAGIRIVVSCLSLMGALTIISITVGKREIFNHKVHPIFVLSIADAMLSVVYIIGGSLWLRSESTAPSRVWCFSATLPTVILQCVTVNLTVLYALLAHAGVRQKFRGNLLMRDDDDEKVWSNRRTTLSYLVAWFLPTALVMLIFATVVTDTDLLEDVNKCSCWCRPSLGNIIPSAKGRDHETVEFMANLRKLVVAFAALIGTHFLAGFIILLFIYGLMIKTIRKIKKRAVRRQNTVGNYGAVGHALIEPVLERAEFQAKKRVTYFLIVFIVTGLFNLILCVELMLFDVVVLVEGEYEPPGVNEQQTWVQKIYYVTLCLQSATITTQGFLNAIVYGWTREDFLSIMAICGEKERPNGSTQLDSDMCVSDTEEELEEEEEAGQHTPGRRRRNENESSREHSFNNATYELETSVQQ